MSVCLEKSWKVFPVCLQTTAMASSEVSALRPAEDTSVSRSPCLLLFTVRTVSFTPSA